MDWIMVLLIALAGSGLVTMFLTFYPATSMIMKFPFAPLIVYIVLAVALGYIAYLVLGVM